MNNRIKELLNQCTNEYVEKPWPLVDAEKFAELIVQECAELTLDYKNDDHYKGWIDYRDEIKKHFGIKE
jgi:hypothetical protein